MIICLLILRTPQQRKEGVILKGKLSLRNKGEQNNISKAFEGKNSALGAPG